MDIELTFKVDGSGVKKLYSGYVRCPDDSKEVVFKTLILALNSEEAIDKIKEFFSQENPTKDLSLYQAKVELEYVIN